MPVRKTGRVDPLGKKENKAVKKTNEVIEDMNRDVPKRRPAQPVDNPVNKVKGKKP